MVIWSQHHKTLFLISINDLIKYAGVLVLGQHFQPYLVFKGKRLHMNGAVLGRAYSGLGYLVILQVLPTYIGLG